MDRAAEAGVLGQLRVRLSLDTDRRSGLSAHNGVAVIPGTGPTDETIIINAHADDTDFGTENVTSNADTARR